MNTIENMQRKAAIKKEIKREIGRYHYSCDLYQQGLILDKIILLVRELTGDPKAHYVRSRPCDI